MCQVCNRNAVALLSFLHGCLGCVCVLHFDTHEKVFHYPVTFLQYTNMYRYWKCNVINGYSCIKKLAVNSIMVYFTWQPYDCPMTVLWLSYDCPMRVVTQSKQAMYSYCILSAYTALLKAGLMTLLTITRLVWQHCCGHFLSITVQGTFPSGWMISVYCTRFSL